VLVPVIVSDGVVVKDPDAVIEGEAVCGQDGRRARE
jgi:hypothetical protein